MTINEFYKELYKRYGTVKRARNCFFYTNKGVRLTDCFQEGGRAILGWEGGNAFTHFKNVLCRGQVGSFLCEDTPRVDKAVSSLLASNRKVFFFNSKMDALKSGLLISKDSTCVYTPWAPANENSTSSDCVVLLPPLPWTDSVYILAVKSELATDELCKLMPNQVAVPFALNTAITRAIYNLIAALQQREEKDWFLYDTVLNKYFERKGPYLRSKVPAEKYDAFVLHCLDKGILINPNPNENSIVPFGADKGVFTALKNSPFNF